MNVRRYWHPECAHDFNLHSRLDTQFDHVAARDGLRCAKCHQNPGRWLANHPHHLTKRNGRCGWVTDGEWLATLWDAPTVPFSQWTDDDRLTGLWQEIARTHALELDHRVPLWAVAHLPDDQRRPYFGPRNLWLLCPPCHKAKTAIEAARRARLRKAGWPESVLHGNPPS